MVGRPLRAPPLHPFPRQPIPTAAVRFGISETENLRLSLSLKAMVWRPVKVKAPLLIKGPALVILDVPSQMTYRVHPRALKTLRKRIQGVLPRLFPRVRGVSV